MFARARQEWREIGKYALPSPQPAYNACITTGDILGLKWLARIGYGGPHFRAAHKRAPLVCRTSEFMYAPPLAAACVHSTPRMLTLLHGIFHFTAHDTSLTVPNSR